ncbi:Universal stress protein family protein [Anatilimnocola aggregata]|uniref:Universal stress protein family protein n=1 Tax=Anatilimnocola aggregata TaxID=2528021 RepID=A0A517Y951_9BACT|nr:universal stress protein [Anatilimnocola aggregata]QDU26745.1 Universal stress protein family protein [Anatilimnocola aggregata]
MNVENNTAVGIAVNAFRSTWLPVPGRYQRGTDPAPSQTLQRRPWEKDIRTIVVLLDGSAHAEHALPHALAIARKSGASLRLVRVYSHLDDIDPWQLSQASASLNSSKYEKKDYLARIARKIDRIDGLQPETVLIDSFNTVDALVNGAAGSDLVVIGSRRRRFASRLWWNNTVDQLRRRLSIPLLLTSGYLAPVDLTANPRSSRILLPLNGSLLGQGVLDSAAQLSRYSGGSLTLLNVQNEQWSLGLFDHTNPRSYLLSVSQQLHEQGIAAEAQIFTTSRDPGQAIATYAVSHDVDLIAIATRGDGGLSRLVRGSVADYLLRHTKIPVLLQNIPDAAKRPELTRVS